MALLEFARRRPAGLSQAQILPGQAIGANRQPSRIEYVIRSEGTAFREGAFGHSGLKSSARARVSVALIQYRGRKRPQARTVVDDRRDPHPLLRDRAKPAG